MACDMRKIANFSKEKQQLIAMCIDSYTNELGNYVNANVDTAPASIENTIRERFENEIMHGEPWCYRTYRKYKNDIFEIIEVMLDQTLPEGWKDNEFMNRFVETKRLDLGDKNEFIVEDNSLLTVSKFSGNHWDTIRERMDLGASYSVPTSWYEVHFYNDFERFMKNIDSFENMLDKARKSFLQSFQGAIYVAFAGLGDVAPDEFVGNGTLATDTEKNQLLDLIDTVSAANGGVRPVIAGTASALRKLQGKIPDAWVAESAKEERKMRGTVTAWEGFDLMAIPQVLKPGTFTAAVSNTQLVIFAGEARPIKFVYEGESRMKEVTSNTENMDQTLENQIQTKAGVAAIVNTTVGAWNLA